MKAVILAAGIGSRLKMSTPKPLAELIKGKSIFDYQVETLSKFVAIDDIWVVVGYKREMVMEKHPELNYVCNADYAKTNTGKSLLTALGKIDDDVLWLNGDVVFDGRLIPRLLTAGCSCLLVDKKKCGEEEVKYNTDSHGYVKGISKELSPAEGEALGVNLIRKKELPILKKHLSLIGDQDYFEKAVQNMIEQENAQFLSIDANGLFCCEIDFPEDLKHVREYLLKYDND